MSLHFSSFLLRVETRTLTTPLIVISRFLPTRPSSLCNAPPCSNSIETVHIWLRFSDWLNHWICASARYCRRKNGDVRGMVKSWQINTGMSAGNQAVGAHPLRRTCRIFTRTLSYVGNSRQNSPLHSNLHRRRAEGVSSDSSRSS